MKSYLKYFLILIVALLGGWFSHDYYSLHIQDHTREVVSLRENSSEYKFINPLILVTDGREIEFEEYTDLKRQIESYIKHIPKQDGVKDVSVYFRNLNSTEWEVINEDVLYAPASMLKVSVLMAYLKMAEDNPNILNEKINYEPKEESGRFYQSRSRLSPGYHTVRELLNQMMVESDNDAMISLDSLHVQEVFKIYNDLKLPDPLQASLDFMSTRAYSRLFRALYNGSYISKVYSEEALKLLSLTHFDGGLVAGVGSTTISHKFGELTNTIDGVVTERELHDCGIVYYPQSPYLICVMTRGEEFKNLERVIGDISKITYDYMKEKKN